MASRRTQPIESKGKTGPKPRPKDELRSARVLTYWLPESIERVRKCAKSLGLSANEFISRETLRAVDREERQRAPSSSPPPDEDQAKIQNKTERSPERVIPTPAPPPTPRSYLDRILNP